MMKIRAIASSQGEALEMMGVSSGDNVKLVGVSLAEFGDSPWYEKFSFTFEVSWFDDDSQYIVDENCEAEYQKALQEYNRRAKEARGYKGLIHPKCDILPRQYVGGFCGQP